MPTKTPREVLKERLKEFVRKRNVSALWQEDFELLTEFIETLLEEARQWWREEIKKEILKIIPLETPKSNGNTMNENDMIERENLLLWQIKFGISSL